MLKDAPLWKVKIIIIISCDESWFYLNYNHDEAFLPAEKIIKRHKKLISDQKEMFFTATICVMLFFLNSTKLHAT